MGRRSYSDAELAAAIARSRSWRGVLRALGLTATSSAAMRSVRRRADEIGLDHGHFTGQRRWMDEELRAAVAAGKSWTDVLDRLGLAGGSSHTTIRGHAIRLGLDIDHLDARRPVTEPVPGMTPDVSLLPRAGSLLAAAWFALCGWDVSWPLEPCRYDLLVARDGRVARVQVKTTRVREGASWTVWLSTTRGKRTPYDPDELDYFFVIDGDWRFYLIPSRTVGGLHAASVNAYRSFQVGALDDLRPPG